MTKTHSVFEITPRSHTGALFSAMHSVAPLVSGSLLDVISQRVTVFFILVTTFVATPRMS